MRRRERHHLGDHLSRERRNIVVHCSKTTVIRRYAPDSVKFDDAKPSTLQEIHPGDQVRARGERSADRTELNAEEIVSGSFRNVAGTVNSVDASSSTLSVQDVLSRKAVLVKVTADSQLRHLLPGDGPANCPALERNGRGRVSSRFSRAPLEASGQTARHSNGEFQHLPPTARLTVRWLREEMARADPRAALRTFSRCSALACFLARRPAQRRCRSACLRRRELRRGHCHPTSSAASSRFCKLLPMPAKP